MTSRKSFLGKAIVFAVCFVMLISALFLIFEADHDCTGEHCLICQQVQICKDILQVLFDTFVVVSLGVALASIVPHIQCAFPSLCGAVSLVSLKVKLSD